MEALGAMEEHQERVNRVVPRQSREWVVRVVRERQDMEVDWLVVLQVRHR
jgi:hypothetical protein